MTAPIHLLWENFGPIHADRCDGLAEAIPGARITGLELYGRSDTYDWVPEGGHHFRKVTLFPEGRPRGFALIRALVAFRRHEGRGIWFLCHYEWPEILAFAFWLRLRGDRVFTMGCSKFDDLPRWAWREWLKSWFYLPYRGAIGSGLRSRDYFRFLGFRPGQVAGEYNTLSIARIRVLAGAPPAPGGVAFEDRHFTIVARLVPKKNLLMALEAYALYAAADFLPRMLHICGNGVLEAELKARAETLGIAERVVFHGFVQSDAVARHLATTLALLLPSVEEQFGNVVIEAQAMGLPVILSDNCGARDSLVRSGVNGFVVEPDNPDGMAWFMEQLATEELLWKRMCKATADFAPRSDVDAFARGVLELVGLDKA